MKTLTVDDKKRIRLPDAKPGQVFVYGRAENGLIQLLPIKREVEEAFPPGSLVKYLIAERDAEQRALLAGCVPGPA